MRMDYVYDPKHVYDQVYFVNLKCFPHNAAYKNQHSVENLSV